MKECVKNAGCDLSPVRSEMYRPAVPKVESMMGRPAVQAVQAVQFEVQQYSMEDRWVTSSTWQYTLQYTACGSMRPRTYTLEADCS